MSSAPLNDNEGPVSIWVDDLPKSEDGLSDILGNEDGNSFSTRGQSLSSLIHRRTTSNINVNQHRRSPSSKLKEDDYEAASSQSTPATSRDERVYPHAWPAPVKLTPQMRSQTLIGNSNPRYLWKQYFKSDEQLKKMSKPIRAYYARNNRLIQQYIFIDKLLDSSLPHNLIQEYQTHTTAGQDIVHPPFVSEADPAAAVGSNPRTDQSAGVVRIKRTPRSLFKLPEESTPLLDSEPEDVEAVSIPPYHPHDDDGGVDVTDRIVTKAIYVNLIANITLLILKVVATVMTSSLSILASLVDGALDFLSTAIVWVSSLLISRQDHHSYPVGRRKLEPIGVLVFSVIMVTSFMQVALKSLGRLGSENQVLLRLSAPAIAIMAGTVAVKLGCWQWCRMIKNPSVQALAQDAMTDVVFNTFSIMFPVAGYYLSASRLDPLGGLLLSVYVIVNWSKTSIEHIRNLTGAAASADQRNVLLYLTMRFAKSIKHIQGLQAYHAGDKLIAEVDVVVDESMSLRDSHDLGESLQYVLESVPIVDRAFVHLDYAKYNLPSHMIQ